MKQDFPVSQMIRNEDSPETAIAEHQREDMKTILCLEEKTP